LLIPVENPELDEEFDLPNLGIDLQATEPLLPYVYYVGSDAPLVKCGQYPVPDSYPKNKETVDATARLNQFLDECLFFCFICTQVINYRKVPFNN
jgi:hypothetical protein